MSESWREVIIGDRVAVYWTATAAPMEAKCPAAEGCLVSIATLGWFNDGWVRLLIGARSVLVPWHAIAALERLEAAVPVEEESLGE